ncbi:Cif family virulence factor [Pseudoblastomonas halimionae]|uniref:DUF4440 domain-containing protein n=1 Tax=Alteriqipengyuania halimionae TaxID=1926630 RepID=A0A6I4U886_9SPHN|nr:hypothetical protein [Alteriqipengyuania halimionae]MXP11103.1 hypothetical protein [Alteriqipengyuania halimionae]
MKPTTAALLIVAMAGSVALGGCTQRTLKNTPGYGQGSGQRLGGRALEAVANPSEVAATDIAFSRAARDEGQWTAFRRFAADGAKIHGKNGVIAAEPWLAAQTDPKAPVQWTPVGVWSSCDGSTAVTQGKFADPDGSWGYYVTVWQRQRDGRYRWVYDMGAPDDELTALENERRDRDAAPRDDNVVVIQAIPAVEGRVADCGVAPATVSGLDDEGATAQGGGSSRDSGLKWQWAQFADGSRRFAVALVREGDWKTMLTFRIGSDGKHIPDQ